MAGQKTRRTRISWLLKGSPCLSIPLSTHVSARQVGRIVVSTDSEKIAEIGRNAEAEIPFIRPAEFAQDHSNDLEVFQHALRWLDENENYRPELIVHLRPTSPLRPSGLIDEGINRLLKHPEADSLRTVVPAPQTPFKMWRLSGEYLEPLLTHPDYPEPYNMPRQLLPPVYWQNAYLDITRWTTVMIKGSMTGDRILALMMSPEDDVDIDHERDLQRAERKGRGRVRQKVSSLTV